MSLINALRIGLLLGALVGLPTAQAGTTLNLLGALGVGSGDAHNSLSSIAPGFGAEFDFGLTGEFEGGVFFDYNFLIGSTGTGVGSSLNSTGGHLLFYGFDFRYYFEGSMGVFGDLQLGLTQAKQDGVSSSAGIGFGIRIGSKIPVGSMYILPFGGFRILPYNVTGGSDLSRTMFDFGAMLAFPLYSG